MINVKSNLRNLRLFTPTFVKLWSRQNLCDWKIQQEGKVAKSLSALVAPKNASKRGPVASN